MLRICFLTWLLLRKLEQLKVAWIGSLLCSHHGLQEYKQKLFANIESFTFSTCVCCHLSKCLNRSRKNETEHVHNSSEIHCVNTVDWMFYILKYHFPVPVLFTWEYSLSYHKPLPPFLKAFVHEPWILSHLCWIMIWLEGKKKKLVSYQIPFQFWFVLSDVHHKHN